MKSILSEGVKGQQEFFNDLAAAYKKNDKIAIEKLRYSLQAWHEEPMTIVRERVQALTKKVQAFGVSTDFPKLVSAAYTVTVEALNYDLGYEAVFREVPVDMSGDTWDIYTVKNGITFHLVPEGGKIQIDSMTGSILTCHTDFYGGAIGWTYKLITKRKIAAMMDIASMFKNNFFQNKATNFYLLIAAGCAAAIVLYGTTAYQGVVADGRIQRDVQTINRAVYDLTSRNINKGYGDMAQIPIVGYRHPLDESRIDAAMTVTTSSLAAAGRTGDTVKRPIRWITTFNANIVQGRPILIIPFNKSQMANVMAPRSFVAPLDNLTLNTNESVWAEYGGGIGDVDVFQTMILA